VFISHRKVDTEAAKAIGKYLTDVIEVDIYLDEYDYQLLSAVASGEDDKIVGYIEQGISISTHMLGIISPSTKGSWWVPFEIGAARQRSIKFAHVLLNNVDDLPSYLRISKLIKDQQEFKAWLQSETIVRLNETKSIGQLNIPGLPIIRSTPPQFRKSS